MKFGEKYELLESVTTGPVETFVAKDVRRGTRVLVHILDCGEQRPNQPTVQWVLEGFHKAAPDPAGLVIEAGRYSGTFYAYLVTELPDEAVLRSWTHRYMLQQQETQEVPPGVKVSKKGNESLAAEMPAIEPAIKPAIKPAQPTGAFTMAFREFSASLEPGPQPDSYPRQGQPSPISESIKVEQSGIQAGDFRDGEIHPRPPAARADLSARKFSENFASSTNLPPRDPALSDRKPKPGEFTSFFQGPFAEAQPTALPPLSQQPPPPTKKLGDFTATFGPLDGNPEESRSAYESSGGVLSDPPGSFTQMFQGIDAPPKAVADPVVPPLSPVPTGTLSPVLPEPSRSPFRSPMESVSYTPLPPPISTPPPEVKPRVMMEPRPSAAEGATSAFTPPGSLPAPAEPAPPAGPGEYTRIIAAVKPSSSSQGTATQAGKAPAGPKLAPPKLEAPKLPDAKPPQAPVSALPVVITLGVLLLLAILIVVYFALKH